MNDMAASMASAPDAYPASSDGASAKHAEGPRAQPSEPMIAFAYAILRAELATLERRRPESRELPTTRDIHQLRISTRRLRVALRLFRRMLPSDAATHLRKELKWFAQALGEARDLDVYTENFRGYVQGMTAEQHAEVGSYELHLRRERNEARAKLTGLFAAPRYSALFEDFAAFLADAPTPAALRRWRSFRVRDGIKKYIKKSLKRVRKLGSRIEVESQARKLHRLRIRAKRLRYELEFFAPVYAELADLAKAAKALQDVLGAHQDACTATARLGDFAKSLRKPGERRASLPPALEQLRRSQMEAARQARHAFAAEWRNFETLIAHTKLAA
jgi:CHAD domain-containing protein